MFNQMAGLDDYEQYLEDEADELDNARYLSAFKSLDNATYNFINSERDLTLPLQKHKIVQPVYESPEDEISLRKYLGASVNLISLITENLLCHPFLVLRRQCQVHHASKRYHVLPVTLIPVIVHLHQRQGVTTLWKGIGSVLLVRGMTLAVEDVISKFTPWPKLFVRGISTRIMCRRVTFYEEQKGARTRDFAAQSQVIEVYSTMISLMTTEMIFFPFETILHRIQLQGTRTIIDNLDSGYSVVPILTSYEGVVDCYRQTVATEGVAGLYKGFGAMILQFAAHVAVIKLGKWFITQISELMSSKPPAKVVEFYKLDDKTPVGSATMSRSISGISSLSNELS
uniref:Uncharacterized protein n=1 Tax=Anopheles atroparvus TaxID=41427 RepID=A0A182IXA1_ANOAO